MIGGGNVGLVSAACFAEFGSDVAVVEVDPVRLKSMARNAIAIADGGRDG
jgi:UDPglucose 6-dehydrogenase